MPGEFAKKQGDRPKRARNLRLQGEEPWMSGGVVARRGAIGFTLRRQPVFQFSTAGKATPLAFVIGNDGNRLFLIFDATSDSGP